MKLSIKDKGKKDLFIALFQNLKNCSNLLCVLFELDHVFIQGMDKSHICLFEVKIQNTWFDSYETSTKCYICFDSQVFHTTISVANEHNDMEIEYDETNEDSQLSIHILTKKEGTGCFNKHFKIPLAEFDYSIMEIPETDYDVEFVMQSKQITEIISQMLVFGSDINIKCDENSIKLIAMGISGEMEVDIPIEDLKEYSIVEDEIIQTSYSLNYIYKMCMNNKLSNTLHFCINKELPMKLFYDLGDNSSCVFYIAPKIVDF